MAPSLVILGAFVVYPMGRALYLSFTDYDVLSPATWIGFDNYTTLIDDEAFRNALKNTLYYAVLATPLCVGLALALAVLLNNRFPLRGRACPHGDLRAQSSSGCRSCRWHGASCSTPTSGG